MAGDQPRNGERPGARAPGAADDGQSLGPRGPARNTAAMTDPSRPPAGWYPDPADVSLLRWWDGTRWTDDRAARPADGPSPGALRSVGDYVTGSFRAVVRVVKPLLVLAAIAIVPLMVALFLADAQLGFADWLDEVVEVVEETEAGEPVDIPRWDVNGASAAIWGAAIMILYLFAFAVLPLAAVPLIDAGLRQVDRDGDDGEEPDLDVAMGAGLRATPRAIGVGLLAALGFLGLAIVPIALLAVVPLLGALVLLAMIPLVIYLSVRLLVIYQPLIMIEGLGVGLFRRSWDLTRGLFWGLFGRSVLFGLIVGFATNIVTIPFQLVGAVDPSRATLFGLVVGAAAGAASGLVQVAGPIVLYRDLVDGPPTPRRPPAWGTPPAP